MRWFPFSSFHVSPFALFVSDHHIAVLRLGSHKEVLSFGQSPLPPDTVENGKVLDRRKLAETLRMICMEAKPGRIDLSEEVPVVLAIPESQSFTHIFLVPSSVAKEKYADAVRAKAAPFIPVDIATLYFDSHIVEHNVGQTDRVLFAAAPKEIIDAYIAVCEEVNLLPIAIDMETASLARAILPVMAKSTLMPAEQNPKVIVDIGARSTTLGFFDNEHRLGLSLSIPIGGNNFTHALVERMHQSWEDAEALKQQQGMNRNIPENRVIIVIQEQLQAVLKQLGRAFAYYESTYRKSPDEIYLAGGSSLMPEIGTYFAMNLHAKVSIGDPLRFILPEDETLRHTKDPLLLAPLIGLALRALLPHPESEGINLLHGWEGERWEEKEKKILLRWRRLAIPLLLASFTLLGSVVYMYVYQPLERLKNANMSRISLSLDTPEKVVVGTTTAPLGGTNLLPESGTSTTSSMNTLPVTTAAPRVRIAETPTGYLNVRKGPGTTFIVTTKVYPNEAYTLVDPINDNDKEKKWVQIKLGSNEQGWVLRQYLDFGTTTP